MAFPASSGQISLFRRLLHLTRDVQACRAELRTLFALLPCDALQPTVWAQASTARNDRLDKLIKAHGIRLRHAVLGLLSCLRFDVQFDVRHPSRSPHSRPISHAALRLLKRSHVDGATP